MERARGEAAALLAERRAEAILERMGDAHCVLDREFRIVGVNAAAERLLGQPRAALLGRSHWEAFPASVDAPVGRAFRRVVEQGVEQHLTHHYTGEGYDLHLELDAYPTEAGGVAMFWRDVTERVRAETALRAGEERMRRQNDALQAVVDGAPVEDALACGLALPSGRPVVTRDVFDEPRWVPWTHIAREHDYRGCWSFPSKTRERRAVGTFAMYFRTPRVALADVVTQTAAVIIASHGASA